VEFTSAGSKVFGGSASVYWSMNGDLQPRYEFNFNIRGSNPLPPTAVRYIQDQGYWMMENISNHESGMKQFCEPGETDSTPYCLNGANPGLPIWGAPGGYGMFQLDPELGGTIPIGWDALWDWRANVVAGRDLLAAKAGPADAPVTNSDGRAYPFWRRQHQQWTDWNATNPDAVIPPPDNQVEGFVGSLCTFEMSFTPILGSPRTYWYGDAVLMLQYAGAPLGNYLAWNDKNPLAPLWVFHKANNVNTNIVRDFCSCFQRSTPPCKRTKP
jgi:hypothetical protein